LSIINDDGSGLRTIFPLQNEPSAEIRQLTWSPDGKSLYFIAEYKDTGPGENLPSKAFSKSGHRTAKAAKSAKKTM
jgi:hypothetical protein